MKFNSLHDIYRAAGSHQVTIQELLNGRCNLQDGGWQEIELSSDLKEYICKAVSEKMGGRQKTKERIFNNLLRERRQHWGLQRFVLSDYGKGVIIEYITGQDQSWENAQMRKDLS